MSVKYVIYGIHWKIRKGGFINFLIENKYAIPSNSLGRKICEEIQLSIITHGLVQELERALNPWKNSSSH